MDPLIAFMAFAGLLVLENLAAQTWLGPYFRFGIPVFYRQLNSPAAHNLTAAGSLLAEQFRASAAHPSIQFHLLAAGQLALREALFENRGGARYLPVMHSLIRVHPNENSLTLTGYLNWYVLAALAYVAYRSVQDSSFLPVAGLVVFLFVLSYALQAGVNRRVVEYLSATRKNA